MRSALKLTPSVAVLVLGCTPEAAEGPCPQVEDACLRAERRDGTCIAVPDVGAPCGEDGTGTCNPAGACAGPQMALSANLEHTCVVLHDKSTWCWGDNTWAQLGNGGYDFAPSPARAELPPAIAIGTGYAHSCAILESGAVACWGDNEAGQSAWPATQTPIPLPAVVIGLEDLRFVAVTAGKGHTCALSDAGDVHCWGYNDYGQCGVDPQSGPGGPTIRAVAPSQTPVLSGVRELIANKNHACALTESQEVQCWGDNSAGQLGADPATIPYSFEPLPVALAGGVHALHVGLGFESSYAVGENQRLYAWGRNSRGQLGNGSTEPDFAPTPSETLFEQDGELVPLESVTDVFRADGSHQCARLAESAPLASSYVCWGGNDYGELGYGTLPVMGEVFPAAHPATALPQNGGRLAFGEDYGCVVVPHDVAVANDYDDVWCWGQRELVGDGSVADPEQAQLEPARVRWIAAAPDG